jgi:ankyrin repeat protein
MSQFNGHSNFNTLFTMPGTYVLPNSIAQQVQIQGYSPLHFAASYGRLEALKYLVQCGSNINAVTGPQSLTPIHFAAIWNHFDIVEAFFDAGASMTANNEGRSIRHSCYMQPSADDKLIKLLLRLGADSNRPHEA